MERYESDAVDSGKTDPSVPELSRLRTGRFFGDNMGRTASPQQKQGG